MPLLMVNPIASAVSTSSDGAVSVNFSAFSNLAAASTLQSDNKFLIVGSQGGRQATGGQVAAFTGLYNGVATFDLRHRYGAPLDGASHPLSTMGLAAAQITFPNIGLTSSTDLSTFEYDTAAWLQAEYDLRTGSGGIIGLCDGAMMRVSQQLNLQDASRVWFHGGRNCSLRTEQVGAKAAIRIASSGGHPSPVLRDLELAAFNDYRSYFSSTQGIAYPGYPTSAAVVQAGTNGYRTGSIGLLVDSISVANRFERVTLVNFDEPLAWGDNVFCLDFVGCNFESCNVGVSWSQTAGLNSMERITFKKCNISNNNTGVLWNAVFDGNAQGGSVHFEDCSIDYNVVSQVDYTGNAVGNQNTNNEMHFRGGHIENNADCIGTNCWVQLRSGVMTFTDVPFYVNGGAPPAIVQIGDRAHGSMVNCRINSNSVPLFYSTTSVQKSVYAVGNSCQATVVRPIMLKDGNGDVMQPLHVPQPLNLFGDTGFPIDFQGRTILQNNSTMTIQPDATDNHAIGTVLELLAVAASGVTIATATGVQLDTFSASALVPQGRSAQIVKIGANRWQLFV